MAKEVRAGWNVVGTLLLVFCTLLLIRFSSQSGGLSDILVSVPPGESTEILDGAPSGKRHPQVRFHPTIVKSSAWDLSDLPGSWQVRTASVDAYLDDDPRRQESMPIHIGPSDPQPIPAERPGEMVNPRHQQARPIPRQPVVERPFSPFSSSRK
jgi:hypothetical protein